MKRLNFAGGILVMACLVAAGSRAVAADEAGSATSNSVLRAYHIGNSLTHGVFNPGGDAKKLFETRGQRYVYGTHILWGSPLSRIWNSPTTNNVAIPPFGSFTNALPGFDWDVMTLQLYTSVIDGEKGDLAMSGKFIDMALARNPDLQVYIYETWPGRGNTNNPLPDFTGLWEAPYAGRQTHGTPCREYARKLVERLRQQYPGMKKPVRLIPVGDVLCALDKPMKDGRIPGCTNAWSVYKDSIHLTAVGNYIAKCTFYAVLFRESPVGLPAPDVLPAEAARLIQETAWSVAGANPLTGIR